MNLIEATQQCRSGLDLQEDQIRDLVPLLLDPAGDETAKTDLLRALTDKGETPEELAGFVRALLPHAVDPGLHGHWLDQRLFDCCGTGGGGLNLVNISTGIMFILAACGVPVVKHGNRGVTKTSGSADVLAALGVPLAQTPEALRRQIEGLGLTFIAAPVFHPAFRHLAPVRQKLAAEGRRTVFNLLGPLLNPCRPASQMVGVFRKEHLDLFAAALGALGRHAYAAVYGVDENGSPLGEASINGPTHLRGNTGLESELPATTPGSIESLKVSSATESAARLEAVLKIPRKQEPVLRALLLRNAAVALRIQGRADSWEAAAHLATEALDSGRAHAKLTEWRAFPV